MSIHKIPTDHKGFDESAMNAWNSLTILIDNEDDALLYEKPENFKIFYTALMDKLLEKTEEE